MSVILSEAKNLSATVRRSGVLLAVCMLAAFAFAQKAPPAKPIDINTATIEQLEQLPGIGPVMAKSIFDFRKKSGPFRRVEDLLAIRGISEKRFIAIRPYVIVPAAAAKPPATASRPAAPPKSAPAPRPAAPASAPKPAAPPK